MKRGHRNKTWIKIQELSKPIEDFDPVPATWQDKYVLRANVQPVNSGETVEGQQLKDNVTHTVSFRWQPDVSTEQRIVIDDETKAEADKRVLHIDGVIDVGDRRRDLVLATIEQK